MPPRPHDDATVEAVWRTYLTTGELPHVRPSFPYSFPRFRALMRRLPTDPRCRVCFAPFAGLGGRLVRGLLGLDRSQLNPQLCNNCEQFARAYGGGAEIELSLLFADVRGSTALAEGLPARDFSQLIDRFYRVTTAVLVRSNALIDKLAGDQVAGLYVPGFAGPQHARVAVAAAQAILRATGHGTAGGAWLPVGVGVHTGVAFVGAVGEPGGLMEITVLGDAANTAARLASAAAAGEVVISAATCGAAALDTAALEARQLALKGRQESVAVCVLRIEPAAP